MKKRFAVVGIVLVAIPILLFHGCGQKGDKQVKSYHTDQFGDNVYVFSPGDNPEEVQGILEEIYEKQETNQFGDDRYAIYFLPGEYDETIQPEVGYYTQISGLGLTPSETKIHDLSALARWLGDDENHNATCNFWRGVENISIQEDTVWAVSQATYFRRNEVNDNLHLHDDYGWASGGFTADTKVTGSIDSGSQQQWLSRNDSYNGWVGENWNLVFLGDQGAPRKTWPEKTYTAVDTTAGVREKPFLIYEEELGFQVYVPGLKKDSKGISWENLGEISHMTLEEYKALSNYEQDVILSLEDFYVAKADVDTAATMNQALSEGKNLILTPGIYDMEEPLLVENAHTIVLGMGLATLRSKGGSSCMQVEDQEGIIIAGILFDAGEVKSKNLMVVGMETDAAQEEKTTPIQLSDLFFRVGGCVTEGPCQSENCITINSSDVIGDNFWVWRADHGDYVAWNENVAENGLTVNGDRVSIYALMVEHFEEYQTIWNGDDGIVVMYQSEIPYDVPEQSVWMTEEHFEADDISEEEYKELYGSYNCGFASIYVSDEAEGFWATGLGIYLYNRDARIILDHAVRVPQFGDAKIHNICTVMLTGNPGMRHVINATGDSVVKAGERQIIIDYSGDSLYNLE